MKFVYTFDEHLKNPEESLDAYVRRKHLELGRELLPIKKIYLDTRFWLLFRDVRLKRRADSELVGLLELLIRFVKKRTAICPISADTFIEVFKQTDAATRRVTVGLIDELSKGISLLAPEERIKLEVLYFLRSKTRGDDAVHTLDELVWTKAGYVLGFLSPEFDGLPVETSCTIQKAFLDQMWSMTLTDILDTLGINADSMPRPNDVSEMQNIGKLQHLSDYSSFKQLFLIELRGMLELHQSMFDQLMVYLYESDTGQRVDGKATGRSCGLANLIYQAFDQNKIRKELPSFRILAGLHTAIRWDAARRYRHNDNHDFQHAVAALSYCDFFLTEKNLRHLVNDKNLQLSTYFRCETFSDISSALSAITRIGATS